MEPIQTSLGVGGGVGLLKVINHIWGAALYITVVRNFRFSGDGGNGKLFFFFFSLSPVGVGIVLIFPQIFTFPLYMDQREIGEKQRQVNI